MSFVTLQIHLRIVCQLDSTEVTEASSYPSRHSTNSQIYRCGLRICIKPCLFWLFLGTPVALPIELDTLVAPTPPTSNEMPSENLKSSVTASVWDKRLDEFLQTRLAGMQVRHTHENPSFDISLVCRYPLHRREVIPALTANE